MTNSDNKYGVFNKQTKIISQFMTTTPSERPWDGKIRLPVKIIFASVDEAKSAIYTDAALAVINETCTQVAWALVNDSDGDASQLKITWAIGTKGDPNIAPEDDWQGLYNSRKKALMDANQWVKGGWGIAFKSTDSSEHLF